MVQCCGCFEFCSPSNDKYQPLYTQGSWGLREVNRTPRAPRRKLSVRYDVVRPVGIQKESDHTVAPCHLPGSLRGPLSNCNNNYPSSNSHDSVQPLRYTPPRTGYPIGPHGCAVHSRLDQPVTTSTPGMDDKKVVQTAPTSGTGQQQRSKTVDTSGVVASISGVRRRSGPQGLRSPAAKRPLSAPVALQGWLHKQGSEGLMLWKKRWFVLSEYCLFYYKGPEEEKLLGSILLPSYRVTVCKPEDKVNKKFAFKAEHANMRTYHFAADTRESMNQWVNALTLASLLQDPNPNAVEQPVALEIAGPADGDRSARPSVSSISSILNQSADDSDSGFHGFQSRDDPSQSNNNSSPNSINTASFPNISASNSNHGNGNNNSPDKTFEDGQPQPIVNGWMQPPPQFNQPSTSQQYNHVQNSVQCHQQQAIHSQQQIHPQHQAMMHQYITRQQLQHQHQQQQQQQQQAGPSNVQTVQPMPRNFGQPVYANAPPKPRRLTDGSTDYSTPSPDPDYRKSPVQPLMRMTAKSPISDYERGNAIYASRLAQQSTASLRTDKSGLNYGYAQAQPAERRTPDTYGRSAQPTRIARGNGDYEDVYSGPQLYQRPAGPVGYSKGPAPVPISIPVYAHQNQGCPTAISPNVPIMRQPRVQQPPRPHSADFLEYEATRRPNSQTTNQNGPQNQQRRPQRPKSSLDVVGPSEATSTNGDGYFYSEERYAAQMRQSAVYLHQTPQQHQQQRNQSLSRATTPSKSSPRVDEQNGSVVMNETPGSVNRRSQKEPVYRQHPMTTQSLQRYADTSNHDAIMRRSLRERTYDSSPRDPALHNDSGTVPRRVTRDFENTQMTPNSRVLDVTYGSHSYHGEHGPRRYSDQQFARSASARLPRTRHPALDPDDDDYSDRTTGQGSRDGERRIQQREESMKRLLEWKQRMLQSPLTRKPSGTTNGVGTAQSELSSYYKRQALLDLAAHEASVAEARHSRRRDDTSHRSHVRSKSSDGRRSVANVSRYNSYSSDDEELNDVRRKRTRRPSHIARSPRQNEETNTPHQIQQSVTFSSAIPPDAGYEEVSFPIQDTINQKNNSITENLTVKTPKKPGILKTPSSYPNRQSVKIDSGRLSTLAGESWQTTKNVQWDSTEDKENWDSRIDESKVIKEFSYQYIKADEISDDKNENWESNLVQSRIKSFECSTDDGSPVREMFSMQEPLIVSQSQAIEAHVSKLESTRIPTNIRRFALGGNDEKNSDVEKEDMNEAKNDGSKSVKDLLADFERKSQQVRKQENNKRDEIKHRGVFSDTETLLYETGSDLDQLEKSEEEIEIVKNSEYKEIDSGAIERNTMDAKVEENTFENFDNTERTIEGLNLEGTPDAFARLSMTESMVTHGDNLSGESGDSPTPKIDDINPEEHYLPMSPRKAILDPNNDDRPDPTMMESLFANLRNEESSYVEMTQNGRGHSLLAPTGDNSKVDSGDYSTLEASHYEFVCVADNKVEPVYMEVSQITDKEEQDNAERSKKKESTNSQSQIRSDLPDILTTLKSDSSDADDESSKDLDSIDAPRHPRFSLSDTFRPASYYLGASRTLIAEMQDSSDSELVSPPPIPTSPPPLDDLDSLEMQDTLEAKKCSPQVPTNRESSRSQSGNTENHRPPSRFSDATISSTFRDSRISLESASGSDSLELRNPEEEARHRRMRRRPVSDDVCEVLDSLDELESLGSRFDGASIDLDQYLEELQARDAFNVDLYAKDLSYNSIYGFNENMLIADKVQKTSQDISKMNLNRSTLDQPFNYNSRAKTSSASSLPSMRVSDAPPSHQHSQSFTGDAHYENVTNFSPLRASPAIRQEPDQNKNRSIHQLSHSRDSSYSMTSNSISGASQRPSSALSTIISYGQRNQSPYHDQRPKHHSRSASQDSARYSLSPNHRSSSSQDSNHVPTTSAIKTTPHTSITSPAVPHALDNNQNNHENDQTGAPYYYSDLQAGVNSVDTQSRSIPTFIAHTSRLPQLNNQRGDSSGLNKRNDIGRLVNPITRQTPRRTEVEEIDEARRIAAELRKTSTQFLVDNKSGLVDKRNFYEADTLRRVKSTDPLPDSSLPDVSTVNLYPHGLRDKSGSQNQLVTGESVQEFPQIPQPTHRRSRSLEGLLDDVDLANLVEQRNRENRVSSVPPTRMREEDDEEMRPSTFTTINTEESFQGEDTWEQDTLWRESLRRVSLRHARSLDNLDTPTRPESSDARTRPKITRGATYVNDSVVLQRLSSPVNVQDRPRIVRRAELQNNENQEDDGAYESLAMDHSTGGYIWNRDNDAYKRQSDDANHFLEEGNLPPVQQTQRRSFELDREKLRQWDLLSSACLLQEQQRTSMAESGRGLQVSERRSVEDGQGMTMMMRMIMEEERRQDQEVAECVGNVDGIIERIRNGDGEKDNGRASGSGSVIGRDPLPPRAVSTSQLSQSPLTQPPTTVSTLPLARANGRQHITGVLPVHQSTPQPTSVRLPATGGNDSDSSICHAPSINDIRPSSSMINNEISRISSPSDTTQRLVSPARNLRVVSPIDHRVSSPSDSERHTHSSSDRLMTSPVNMREMNGDSGSHRNISRVVQGRESTTDLVQKRARLVELDQPRRLENLQKLEELKKHLMDLEKQYEKGKPLVNLVDNMVKLGTLYNRNGVNGSVSGSRHDLIQTQEVTREQRERLEFNHRIQEQRLLAEERRDWERLSPDHGQLQAKVQQLYKLDRLLQEESGTLHSLQQDKELLEKALGGLRHKLQGNRSNPAEVERYKKQQILLERELSRVRMLLAHNSKKLEETVAENARLEQDLVVLRQKLQASRRYAGSMTRDTSGTTVALETELRRVQQLVGDLQRQRQELSVQVRQLTEKSHSLVQQIKPNQVSTVSPAPQVYHPKKRTQSSWLETDLDSGMTLDHGLDSPSSSNCSMSPRNRQNGSPHQPLQSPQYKEPPAPYKEPPTHRYSPTSSLSNRQIQSPNPSQSNYQHTYHRDTQQNHITTISPQLREQIQQHQLKQQLLKDQMQGKGSPIQSTVPLYVNTDSRRTNSTDSIKRIESGINGMAILPPEYIPPPPPPPCEEALMVNGGYGHEDNKFSGLIPNREKQEIKTVRIVKRESERRQRDRGDRNGNIGIPITNGLQVPGSAKRIGEDEFGSQQFEKAQLGKVVEESALIHAQSTVQLSELDDIQFQRSMSLPRGFGGQRPQPGVHNGPVPPPPRSDSMNALRNMMARRHRVRFENEGSSDSTLSPYTESPTSSTHVPMSSPNYSSPSYSPSHQNYLSPYTRLPNTQIMPCMTSQTGSVSSGRTDSLGSPMSPTLASPGPVQSVQDRLSGSAISINSIGESPQLSPVFKSEAAKQIIKEMTEKKSDGPRRRQVPKEKRRHYTVSSSKPMFDLEDTFAKMGMGRARDDLDMERALRPRINAPDVVRSTLSHKELKYNESTIDQLLGTPNKIVIPERYIPEQTPELSAEEKKQRLKKADAIRKMLSETTVTTPEGDDENIDIQKSNSLKKKVAEEKRQRDHILQLNQILAKQVMEKSKMVAVKALATLPLNTEPSFDEDDLSPVTPLPLYQQRENFYS